MNSSQENDWAVFDGLIDNLELVVNQLKDGESNRRAEDGFSLEVFWRKIGAAVKAVSIEATKLCLAFSQPPYPKPSECRPLIARIEEITLALVSAFYGLPKTQGLTLRTVVKSSTVGVVTAVQNLAKIITTEGAHGSPEQRQSTGSVWECCDNFAKLPKNNVQAVLRNTNQTYELVKDALEEIEEAKNNESEGCWDDLDDILESEGHIRDNQVTWSAADKELLAPSIGLIKASKSCVKKVSVAVKKNGSCECEGNVSQLDDLADKVQAVSPLVDDLAASLYAPMKQDMVRQNAEKLSAVLEDLLTCSKHSHVTSEDDANWLEFLLKAIRHNKDKAIALIQKCT